MTLGTGAFGALGRVGPQGVVLAGAELGHGLARALVARVDRGVVLAGAVLWGELQAAWSVLVGTWLD